MSSRRCFITARAGSRTLPRQHHLDASHHKPSSDSGFPLACQDPDYAHFLREALAADKGCNISDRRAAMCQP